LTRAFDFEMNSKSTSPRGRFNEMLHFCSMSLWLGVLCLAGDGDSLRLGGEWLLNNRREDGLFRYGWEPALNQDLDEENLIRQAGTAAALARVGTLLPDASMIARARGVMQILLEVRDRWSKERVSQRKRLEKEQGGHPVGLAALLLLGLSELPTRTNEEEEQGDRLAQYLLACQRPDGSIRLTTNDDPEGDEGDVAETGWAYYPGEALYALARWGVIHRDPSCLSGVERSLAVYRRLWGERKEAAFVAWQSAAHAELFLAGGSEKSALFVCEMNDWLLDLQFDGSSTPTGWKGGFGQYYQGERWASEPGITTASYAESLVEAVRVANRMKDAQRSARYHKALEAALEFVRRLQYRADRLGHFEPGYRASLVGAFFEAPSSGTVRIDFTQHALMAMGGWSKLPALDRVARGGRP
jgi:hypothetical protein